MFTPQDIRRLRDRLGLTQRKFGDLLGVDNSTVSLWEGGQRHPTYAMMQELNKLARKHGLEQPA